jgi:hypothetical protein
VLCIKEAISSDILWSRSRWLLQSSSFHASLWHKLNNLWKCWATRAKRLSKCVLCCVRHWPWFSFTTDIIGLNVHLLYMQASYCIFWSTDAKVITQHYRNTMLDIVHCLRYTWYTRRFGSWLFSRLVSRVRYQPLSLRKKLCKNLKTITNHLKTGIESSPETSCISRYTSDDGQCAT